MYASREDMINRFSETEVNQLESMHTDGFKAMQDALTDATQEMNSYIGAKYTLPLPEVTQHLTIICCNIARYRLFYGKATEEVEKRYEEAIRWLEKVAAGKAVITFSQPLTATQEDVLNTNPQTPVTVSNKSQIFSRDILKQMQRF